ncbi:MAG: hypothetical protein Q8K78_09210 [Planctomycetaceae bacterium]|nr:hypothetical protein [Planctomycetaceae bacterium]
MVAELSAVVRQLEEKHIPYALCGGLAVALHGHVRATQDIDLLVLAEDVEALKQAVAEIGYNLEGGILPVGFGEEHPCDIHRISRAIGRSIVTLDLIVVNRTLQPAWNSRRQFHWHDQSTWVVSRDGLGIMKRLSRRPIDLHDLTMLGIATDDLPTS